MSVKTAMGYFSNKPQERHEGGQQLETALTFNLSMASLVRNSNFRGKVPPCLVGLDSRLGREGEGETE